MLLAGAFAAALAGWYSLRYAWWRPAVDDRWPRILMYHMIAAPRPRARFNGLRVAPGAFEWQLSWLARHGWTSFTVSELLHGGTALPPRSFAITFDDGYADNLLQALPLLKKYRCKATLYLVVDRCGRDWSIERKAHHDEGELAREAKLSDAQVRELLDSGCIELGSHGMTHANFARLDSEAVLYEMSESRRRLEQDFGVAVRSFAFPFGIYRPEHLALARQAGYSSAVTTREGIDDTSGREAMALRRIKISGKDNRLAFRLRMRTGTRGW
jgi:peptidoglycan/xylan/chitin deacetylase (PgdA/CDA1 family)